jgi:hypothetical protein
MKKRITSIVLGLAVLGTVVVLQTGCTVTVSGSVDPVTAPPVAPVVSVTCGPNQYLRGGKHVWRNGAWNWVAPVCVVRAATWRAGCRWTRGHWAKRGRRYAFQQGRLVCPQSGVIRAVGPTVEPPAPPMVRITCGANQFLRGGKHVWRGGRWVWVAPRCVARAANWRAGCRWTRGGWKRVGGRLRYSAGRLFCPKVIPLRVVHPMYLPPVKPPKTYRRARCARGQRYYPGRYMWSNLARRYTWRGGKCIPKKRGCRWVKGRWTRNNGRSFYVRPAWRCRGKLSYVGYGGAWTPPTTYSGFIRRKACRRGYYRNVQNRCVRAKRRCPAGFRLRRGRCYKPMVVKRCGRGWVLRAGRCMRPAGHVRACRPGFRRVGTRCVQSAAPRRCRPGFALRGRKCVKVRGAKRCRPGFLLRGRKCVKVRGAIKKCPRGFALRGRKCIKVRGAIKKCPRGFSLRGRKCIKVRSAIKKCPRGFSLRGNKCIKVRRAVKKCPRGFSLRGNKCIKIRAAVVKCPRGFNRRGNKCIRVAKPAMRVKRCRRGFVRRGKRCVKRR